MIYYRCPHFKGLFVFLAFHTLRISCVGLNNSYVGLNLLRWCQSAFRPRHSLAGVASAIYTDSVMTTLESCVNAGPVLTLSHMHCLPFQWLIAVMELATVTPQFWSYWCWFQWLISCWMLLLRNKWFSRRFKTDLKIICVEFRDLSNTGKYDIIISLRIFHGNTPLDHV